MDNNSEIENSVDIEDNIKEEPQTQMYCTSQSDENLQIKDEPLLTPEECIQDLTLEDDGTTPVPSPDSHSSCSNKSMKRQGSDIELQPQKKQKHDDCIRNEEKSIYYVDNKRLNSDYSDGYDNMSKYLYIANIPRHFKQHQIRAFILKACPLVNDCTVYIFRRTLVDYLGSILVKFNNVDDCKLAISCINGAEVDGKKLYAVPDIGDCLKEIYKMNIIALRYKIAFGDITDWRSLEIQRRDSVDCPDVITLSTPESGDADLLYGFKEDFLSKFDIKAPLCNGVVVKNIPSNLQEYEIRQVFELAGHILYIDLRRQKEKIVTIVYCHPVEAVQAVSLFHGQIVFNNIISVVMMKDCVKSFHSIQSIGKGFAKDGTSLPNVQIEHDKIMKKHSSNFNKDLIDDRVFEMPSQTWRHETTMRDELIECIYKYKEQGLSPYKIISAVNYVYGISVGPTSASPNVGQSAPVVQPFSGPQFNSNFGPQTRPQMYGPNVNYGPNPQSAPCGPPMATGNMYGPMQPIGPNCGPRPVFNTNVQSRRNSSPRVHPVNSSGSMEGSPNNSAPTPPPHAKATVHQDGDGSNSSSESGQKKKLRNTCKMVVFSGLPLNVTQPVLTQKMRECGEVKFVELTSPGNAFVRFFTPTAAEKCLLLFDKSRVDGQVISARYF